MCSTCVNFRYINRKRAVLLSRNESVRQIHRYPGPFSSHAVCIGPRLFSVLYRILDVDLYVELSGVSWFALDGGFDHGEHRDDRQRACDENDSFVYMSTYFYVNL